MFFVGMLKGGSHGVALQQGDLPDKLIPGLCTYVSAPAASSHTSIQRTFISRKILEIDQHRKVVAWLGGDNIFAIFSVQNLFSAILDEVPVALDLD